ncbi:hypothetical protein PC119_g11107 [Phytophthora cactorum]|nr:hypothetical protein PC114_g11581 [Phytophthora cactorum]KAG3017266.1 hypothetical protein PC119_g11107 [Phytophthora cactorum]
MSWISIALHQESCCWFIPSFENVDQCEKYGTGIIASFPGTTTLSDTDKKKDSTKVPRSLLNTPFQWCMGYMALAHGL